MSIIENVIWGLCGICLIILIIMIIIFLICKFINFIIDDDEYYYADLCKDNSSNYNKKICCSKGKILNILNQCVDPNTPAKPAGQR